MSEDRYAMVLTSVGSEEEAENLASGLVEHRLAACVQRTRITSHYMWKGVATKSDEILMLIKTKTVKVAAIQEYIENHHSYDTPEVVVLAVTTGSAKYLRWIDEALG